MNTERLTGALACMALTTGLALTTGCANGGDVASDDDAASSEFDLVPDGEFTVLRHASRQFSLPAAAPGRYKVQITGTGDADLYVRTGTAPTTTRFDCRPYLDGSNETCEVTLTATATIRIMVRGYAATSTVRLSVRPDPPTTHFTFTKQYRSLLDDEVFLVGVSGELDPGVAVQSLELTGPTGSTLLRDDDIGIWIDDAAAHRFLLFAVSPIPYPTGSYQLSLQRTDGSAVDQTIAIEDTVSQGRPTTLEPASLATVSTQPLFQFESFVSPQFTGAETRTLSLTVEQAAGNHQVWEYDPADPDTTQAAIGDPRATGVTQLEPVEHVLAVGHVESTIVGDVDVGLENRVTTHFLVE